MPETNDSARNIDFWKMRPVRLLTIATAIDQRSPAEKNPATKNGNPSAVFKWVPARIGPAANANQAMTVGEDTARPTKVKLCNNFYHTQQHLKLYILFPFVHVRAMSALHAGNATVIQCS